MTEAKLPMAVSLKWVSHACRMAGASKPRWSREHATWTTTARRHGGEQETINITAPEPDLVRLDSTSDSAHKILAGLYSGMRAHSKAASMSATLYGSHVDMR
jgi:hypothetical protein